MLLLLVEEMLSLIGGLVVAYFIYIFLTYEDDKPVADTPTMAHTALRELVERAVEEARKLPGLGGSDAGRSHQASDISEQTYEDLLATAILNKVVEKYQRERVDDNSNVLHRKSASRPKYITSEIEVGLDDGVEEGSSSLEPLSQDEYSSDCSAPPQIFVRNRQEPLSLTIEERIEEVTTTYTSDEEHDNCGSNGLDFRKSHRVPFPEFGMDIIDPSQESSDDGNNVITTPTHVDLVSPVESWEENWLFQKKKIQSQSEPVAMLVPNPSEDFRALIGDKDAEDTSDLSECSAQSDEEIEDELIEAINNVVPQQPDSSERGNIQDLKEGLLRQTEMRQHTTEAAVITLRNENNPINISESNDALQERIYTSGNEKEQEIGTEDRKPRVEGGKSIDIKLSFEDMLVFHMNDEGSQKDQRLSRHQDSTDFIEMEKQEKGDYVTTSVVESKTMDSFQRENSNETKKDTKLDVTIRSHSGEISQSTKEVRHTTREFIVLEKNDSLSDLNRELKTAETEGQSIRSIDISEDHVDSSEGQARPASALMTRELRFTEESLALGLPKTPPPTPSVGLSSERTSSGDFYSLDEKLVSIESKVGSQLGFLKENQDNDGEDTVPISPPFQFKNTIGFDDVDKAEPMSFGIASLQDLREENRHRKRDLQNDDAQQESEYTEHYATATQRHMDSLKRNVKVENVVGQPDNDDNDDVPPPIPTSPPPIEQCREAMALARAQPAQPEAIERKRVEVDMALATPPRPGTIAEREHKKWENAAPIENNPYSEENIQKRLWERKYSRRASREVSGESCEPPNTPTTPIQVVLGANQPDFKRYEKDYYINDRKAAAGESSRKSTMSVTGRPDSSLSHHSSLTGSELEPQVSYGLDRFEEASLRGSLRRRSFRGPNASPQFVINPLLHLALGDERQIIQVDKLRDEGAVDHPVLDLKVMGHENVPLGESSQNIDEWPGDSKSRYQSSQDDDGRYKNDDDSKETEKQAPIRKGTNSAGQDLIAEGSETEDQKEQFRIIVDDYSGCKYIVNPLNVCYYLGGTDDDETTDRDRSLDYQKVNFSEASPESSASISDLITQGEDSKLKFLDDSGKLVDLQDENFKKYFKITDALESFAVNPLYRHENNYIRDKLPGGPNLADRDSGMYSIGSNETTELPVNRLEGENHIPKRLSVNEAKTSNENHFVTTNGKKYTNFGNYKFHTFGGIKRRRINWEKLEEEFGESESENEGIYEFPDNESEFASLKYQTFGGIKRRSRIDGRTIFEDNKLKLRPPLTLKKAKNLKSKREMQSCQTKDRLNENFQIRRDPRLYYKSMGYTRSSSSSDKLRTPRKKKCSIGENLKERIAERDVGDENIMINFLRDALSRPKSRLSTDNDSVYSLDTAKKRLLSFREDFRRKSEKHSPGDSTSLRLEPPGTPEVIQKSFETLSSLRKASSGSDNQSSISAGCRLSRKITQCDSIW